MKNPQCPTCGSEMIRRVAGKGEYKGKAFYGCSRFPLCKAIVNIPENQQNQPAGATDSRRTRPVQELSKEPETPKQPETPLTDKQRFVLTKLRDQLLDISTSNRSVRLNHIYDLWSFDLHSLLPEFGPEYVNDILEKCLRRQLTAKLLPLNSKNEKIERLSNQLTKLYRNAKDIEVEKGLYDLNIGFPFISGLTKEGKVVQAPVLLMPVRLEKHFPQRGEPYWVVSQSKDIPVIFNKTMLLALSKFNGNEINNDIYEKEIPEELHGKSNFMEWVATTLNDNGIPCELDPDAYDEVIDRLPQFNVDEIPASIKPGHLSVKQCAVLGHFPQANSSILNDYEYFLRSSQEGISNLLPIIDTEITGQEDTQNFVSDSSPAEISESSNCPLSLDDLPEKDNAFLLPADGSQEKIVLSLYDEKVPGIVIWGPPGTGKSQTIVNLIGHSLAKGMTCLVVCQKRAALDVVYDRIDSLGLSRYVAIVHDSRKDRKDLYSKLEEHTIPKEVVPAQPQSYSELSTSIEGQTQSLNTVYKTLNDKSHRNIAPIEMYRQKRYEVPSAFILPDCCRQLTADVLRKMIEEINQYQRLNGSIQNNHPWRYRKSFHNLGSLDMKGLLSELQGIIECESALLANIDVLTEHASWQSATNLHLDYRPQKSWSFTDLLLLHGSNRSLFRWCSWQFWKRRMSIRAVTRNATRYLANFSSSIANCLGKYLQPDRMEEIRNRLKAFESVVADLGSLHSSLREDFDTLVSIDKCYAASSEMARCCIDALQELNHHHEMSSAVSWGEIVRSCAYEIWIDELERASNVPNDITVGTVDALISDYKQNIVAKYKSTAKWLYHKLLLGGCAPVNLQLLRKLKGHVGKKRNIPSIRKLNDELMKFGYHKLTTPCWLVSPETVSDVFPLVKGLFDVVIFDEASQCPVKNALPAVFRGKKVFVAGDEKQLPPLTLFESSQQDGYEGTENEMKNIDALEAPSFLNLANKLPKYRESPLSWHYRSEHEELIAFSNHAFYNGLMRTCPNCRPYNSEAAPAIEWTKVGGYWIDRSNEVEANLVVDLIRGHLSQFPGNSLGVITFNAEQRALILNKIDNMCQIDSVFKSLILENSQLKLDEQLFVKNIENVQGDERDTIIFSVAYAPSMPGGKVIQQFGLLNLEGGENRLNVAVTRARKKVHVVCSIDPETELNPSNSRYLGPKRFQQYLIYAKAVSEKNEERVIALLKELNPSMSVTKQKGAISFESPFEEAVYHALLQRGYDVHSQVGQSGFRIDLCVVDPKDPSRYLLGIECDGAKYHSSQSARDRDVFRHKFLERKGWKIYRVWSTRWWRDKKRELDRIETHIQSLL